jgi:hypothetical protein
MCVRCLDSSKLTAGKIHDAPAVNELCTAYSDLTSMADCSDMKDPIHLLPYISAINHMIYYL